MLFGKIFDNSLNYVYIELFFILYICYIIVIGVVTNSNSIYYYSKNLIKLNKLSNFVILILIFMVYYIYLNHVNAFLFFYQYMINDEVLYFKILLLISMFFFFKVTNIYLIKDYIFIFEYIILLWLSLFGLLILIGVNDFIGFYLTLELQSLSLFILSAIKFNTNYSSEAALKYFFLSSYSSGILLFGILLIYMVTGLVNFIDLQNYLLIVDFKYESFLLLGLLLVISSIFFKLSIVPFHNWTVDVYEGVPTNITLFFIIAVKIILFGFFYKLFNILFVLNNFFNILVIIGSILSILIGSFGAVNEVKIKRILAYSTISHSGYILLSFYILNYYNFVILFFYLLVYIIINFGIFSIIINVRFRELKIKYIENYISMYFWNKILSCYFILFLMSLGSLPPLLGFFSKLLLLLGLSGILEYSLIVLVLLLSLVGLFVYVRIIRLINYDFFNKNYFWNFYDTLNREQAFIITFFNMLNISTYFLLYLNEFYIFLIF